MRGIIILLFCLKITINNAQDLNGAISQKPQPLAQVLNSIETHYNIRFSYAPELIRGQSIVFSRPQQLLDDVILELEQAFALRFEKVNDRYYIIYNKQNPSLIYGYLTDAATHNPVDGAYVLNLSSGKTTVSESDGYFSLNEINKGDSVSISFIGYQTQIIKTDTIDNKKSLRILLSPATLALNEVVVNEYHASGISRNMDGEITFTPEAIHFLSGRAEPDILQNIQLLPGIVSPNESASQLHIRGGTPDHNLILWDGIKMYNSSHFFGMISAFNSSIVKDVYISKSRTNPKYGDRISGVIDIVTEDIVPEKPSGEVGLSMLHGDALIRVPVSKRIGLIASCRRSFTDLFPTPTYQQFSKKVYQNTSIDNALEQPGLPSDENENFSFYDYTFKLIAKPTQKDQLTLSGINTRNTLDYNLNTINPDNTLSENLLIKNAGLTLAWDKNWDLGLKTSTRLYFSNYDLSYRGINTVLENSSEKRNNVKEHGLLVDANWFLTERSTLSGGYQFFSNKTAYLFDNTNGNQFGEDLKGMVHAVHGRFKYIQPEGWRFGVGVRVSHYSVLNKIHIEPRLFLERSLGRYINLTSSLETKYQTINQLLEFTTKNFGLENNVWTLASKDGTPLLDSEQVTLGFIFSKNGWNVDLELYHKHNDGFTTITNGINSSIESYYVGGSNTNGFDFNLRKKIKNYSIWLAYTNAKTIYQFHVFNKGKRFNGNNDIRHAVTWSNSYKIRNFHFSTAWNIRSGIHYTPAIGIREYSNEVDYGEINSKVLPGYHRLDMAINYQFKAFGKLKKSRLKIGASLLNVYNRKNTLSREYIVTNQEESNDKKSEVKIIDNYSLARALNITMRINF
ncbi:MAG: TonB-dependent receptor [Carboxylicivirga sp.]|jgi:hypothetical protein|nr:TonB-dependent receptor [Carboxylicivirga sp.]